MAHHSDLLDGPNTSRSRLLNDARGGRMNSRSWTLRAMDEIDELAAEGPLDLVEEEPVVG